METHLCPLRMNLISAKFSLIYLAVLHVGSQFSNQGLNSHPLHWKCGVLTTGPPGMSLSLFFNLIFNRSSHMTRSAGRNQDQSLPRVPPGRATQENHPLDLSYLGGHLLLSLNILISISCDLIPSCQVSAVLSLKFQYPLGLARRKPMWTEPAP